MRLDILSRVPRAASEKRTRFGAAAAAVAATALVLAGCSGNDGGDDDEVLTMWASGGTQEDRVAQIEAILDDFTAETGVEVDLVSVDEDQFHQLLTASAAADDLPDVIAQLSLAQVRTLATNQLVDVEATASVVEGLGPDTFTERALELTRDGEDQLAVPSEYWAQLLYYRTDLFEEAGLEPPETYEDILNAAEALDGPDMAGFVGATTPGDAFTHQTFEHIALGNGCEMVSDTGEVTFDSAECAEALGFYAELIGNYSVSGTQDVDTVRAQYFAGQAAMFIWSTYVLDEMAGLRDDALPTCSECSDEPAFLAQNTGAVPAIQGPSGTQPGQFGEITNWVITTDAADSSQDLVEYMLSDGYEPWLAIAAEGRVPVRTGNSENPTEYADLWAELDVGVDTLAPLGDFYGDEMLAPLQAGPEEMIRWGITQGQGDLVGAAMGELPIAAAVGEATTGTDPQEAANTAAENLRSIQGE